MSETGQSAGRRIRLDLTAKSQTPGQRAFASKPAGAPVYHGFPVLDDVEIDGFRLGMITDWEATETDVGDAFLVAPDGSRAGLVWEVGGRFYVTECLAVTPDRWGVWNVGFTRPMRSREDAGANLADVLEVLLPAWQQWKSARGPTPGPS